MNRPFLPAASLLALSLLGPAAPAQFEVLQADQGRVALHFFDDTLAAAGLHLQVDATDVAGDDAVEQMEGPFEAFLIDPSSDLLFLAGHQGGFQPYGVLGGAVRVLGGFTLSSPATGVSVDFHGFEIHPLPVRNDGPGGEPDPDYFFLSRPGASPGQDFLLCYVKISWTEEGGYPGGEPSGSGHTPLHLLRVKAWDLIVGESLAAELGIPELAGTILGTGKVEAFAWPHEGAWDYPAGQNAWTPYSGGGTEPPSAGEGSVVDVKLGLLSGIKQIGHLGTFPNGTTSLAMSTTSCNVGDVNVDWKAPMNEDHPGILQSLYRESGGRLEQIGTAWVKHGFFALSNSQCTPCQNPSGSGTFLGVGCSDTYGTSNNSDRFYLGPKSEWNGFLSTWECLGSYFDGLPVDCIRDENGSGLGVIAHRLEVSDADLDDPGATYYYEGRYLVQEDADVHNNVGSRLCTMTWNGFAWTFTTPGTDNALLEGPALERWGDLRTEAGLEPADGSVILAVDVTDLGSGAWRYEYALYNWTLDRQVRSFSVPVCGNPSALSFHDLDAFPENDWVATVAGGNVAWEFPDVDVVADMVAGPLDFGLLYNFGFTSTVGPGDRQAALDIHLAGAGGDRLGVATLAPACLDLSASKLAPAVAEVVNLTVEGGTDHALLAVLSVSGIPITPIILPGAPVPFVGGSFTLPVVMPSFATGLDFTMVGADVTATVSLLDLSNLITLDVQ